MTGITSRRPTLHVAQTTTSQYDSKAISPIRTPQLIEIQTFQTDLNNLPKDIVLVADKRRQKTIKVHDKATNIFTPSFRVSDFVLVRKAQDRGQKLQFGWFGPH